MSHAALFTVLCIPRLCMCFWLNFRLANRQIDLVFREAGAQVWPPVSSCRAAFSPLSACTGTSELQPKFIALSTGVSLAVNRDVAEPARWIFQQLLVTR